jgi:hypothetical protein
VGSIHEDQDCVLFSAISPTPRILQTYSRMSINRRCCMATPGTVQTHSRHLINACDKYKKIQKELSVYTETYVSFLKGLFRSCPNPTEKS